MSEPDFEKLRAKRNESIREMIRILATEEGWNPEDITHNFDFDSCYCACDEHGPCEHKWGGWREFDDGRGGEQFCERCGMGAMSHSMRFLP